MLIAGHTLKGVPHCRGLRQRKIVHRERKIRGDVVGWGEKRRSGEPGRRLSFQKTSHRRLHKLTGTKKQKWEGLRLFNRADREVARIVRGGKGADQSVACKGRREGKEYSAGLSKNRGGRKAQSTNAGHTEKTMTA